MESGSNASWFGRNNFMLRRLHSLSGLIPVGVYMVVHLTTNASVVAGVDVFQKNVGMIHTLGPVLPLVEWVFIFLPLLFHMLVGFVFIWSAQPNNTDYPYTNNARYTMQRVTGVIAAVFLVFHVLTLHKMGLGQFDPHHAASSAALALQRATWVQVLYGIGILACVYHLANGIWTMGITWGVWISPAAQSRASWVCFVIGILVGIIGLTPLWKLSSMSADEINHAREVEKRILDAHTSETTGPSIMPVEESK